jgi:hypothetical protein
MVAIEDPGTDTSTTRGLDNGLESVNLKEATRQVRDVLSNREGGQHAGYTTSDMGYI